MNNPYVNYALQKGYTSSEIRKTKKPTRTFPYTVGYRTFHSEEEYQEALHDFMNGY
jgi:hypothetical protein